MKRYSLSSEPNSGAVTGFWKGDGGGGGPGNC